MLEEPLLSTLDRNACTITIANKLDMFTLSVTTPDIDVAQVQYNWITVPADRLGYVIIDMVELAHIHGIEAHIHIANNAPGTWLVKGKYTVLTVTYTLPINRLIGDTESEAQ